MDEIFAMMHFVGKLDMTLIDGQMTAMLTLRELDEGIWTVLIGALILKHKDCQVAKTLMLSMSRDFFEPKRFIELDCSAMDYNTEIEVGRSTPFVR